MTLRLKHERRNTLMDNARLLSQQQILADWWQEVNEYFFQDTRPCVRKLIKALLEDSLIIARDNYMQTGWHKHDLNREDFRNGFYPRTWKTQLGLIEKLWIPRCRKKSLTKELLKRYKDNEESINNLIKDIFLAGVSTNRVGEVLEPIIGKRISRQTVSNVVAKLDIELQQYHARSFNEPYLYLFFDGIVLNGKDSLGAKKRFVLVAYGIKPSGERELIDFMLAGSESYNAWYKLVNDLRQRNLNVTRLIITDGAKGLHKALDELYPRIKRQRCWVHKLRNMAKYTKKSISEKFTDEARGIYKADTKRQAVKRFRRLKSKWYRLAPKAIECLQKDIDEMLNFFECPKEHRIKIRTTNAIERVFREVRRRTRPMNCFTNDASCERILYGLFYYYNKKYKRNIVKVIAERQADLTEAA
jgi:putative transposase